tara:strand:+ start:1146 stop:1700 length:555 start_codon:yes stop_codon:yes gene_type:complete
MIVAVLVFVAIVIVFFAMNNSKSADSEREGLVREVLSKDAVLVQFDDSKTVVTRFFGVSMASESEMMDENILKFLNEQVVGHRMKIKPNRIDNGDVYIAEIHTLGGEYLNASLIEQGFARWNPSEAGGDGRLTTAQDFAKASMLGIWNPAIQKIVQDNLEQQEENLEGDVANEGGDDMPAASAP